MNFIVIAILVLGSIALVAALVLFGVSKKFAVEEDPRLGQVGEILPGANCGGCGFPDVLVWLLPLSRVLMPVLSKDRCVL